MLEHDRWATSVLLDLSRGLSDAQLDQPFDIGHGTLRATFAHMIPNVVSWTRYMSGLPGEGRPGGASITGLTELYERSYAAFATLARQFRDDQRLDDIFVDHYQVRKSFGGTILMVIQHNAEHRTEIIHILSRLGVPNVPEVDFGVWDYLQHNS
jgi:uncharacterized damage-inducible protein DinB